MHCLEVRSCQLGQNKTWAHHLAGIFSLDICSEVECGAGFSPSCYVVSGFITAYSKGKSKEKVQAEVSQLLQAVFDMGNLPTTVPGVDGVALRSVIQGTQSPTTPDILTLDVRTQFFPLPVVPAPTPGNAPLMPTRVPTVTEAPFVASNNAAASESKSPTTDSDSDSEGLEWWRWLIFAFVILVMLVAIYIVWFRCPCRSQEEHASIPEEDYPFQDEDSWREMAQE